MGGGCKEGNQPYLGKDYHESYQNHIFFPQGQFFPSKTSGKQTKELLGSS